MRSKKLNKKIVMSVAVSPELALRLKIDAARRNLSRSALLTQFAESHLQQQAIDARATAGERGAR